MSVVFSATAKNGNAPVFLHNEKTGENIPCKITGCTWECAPNEITTEDGRVFTRRNEKVKAAFLELTVFGGWICGDEIIKGYPICDGVRIY